MKIGPIRLSPCGYCRSNYEKNTPFCSRPRTEIRFCWLVGSDLKVNPSCSDDQLMVVLVEKNVPLK